MTKKILIIRFNSIGDIVLTSPVVEALASSGYEVHYLVKSAFASLLVPNPNVHKVWELKADLNAVISSLKNEHFDAVVDLHNNLRSAKVKRALNLKSYTFQKPRIKYFLLTKFGFKIKPEAHIVDRFLNVVKPIVGPIEKPNTVFYFEPPSAKLNLVNLPDNYVVIAVGAAFKTKTIPAKKLTSLISKLRNNIVLIGGPGDVNNAKLIEDSSNRKIYNLVGQVSLSDSARVIRKSELLVSGDTGMMHIGAALNVRMLNVFGSTHPILGYTPHYGNNSNKSIIVENHELSCRPCTKQGQKECPKGHFKCMNDISVDQMLKVIQ